jgi:hypothetical protein
VKEEGERPGERQRGIHRWRDGGKRKRGRGRVKETKGGRGTEFLRQRGRKRLETEGRNRGERCRENGRERKRRRDKGESQKGRERGIDRGEKYHERNIVEEER